MIAKRINSEQKRRSKETNNYIVDAEHDGEKLLYCGMLNCFSDDIKDAKEEMHNDELAYQGEGDAVAHWMFSIHENENITQEQTIELLHEFIKDQGMQDHKVIYAVHDNTNNIHIHLTLLRVKPEAEENGSYKIQNFGGREKWNNGTNNEVMSARATVIDFCNKHGFKQDFKEVHTQRDENAIKLSQKIEAAEAQNKQPHPKRLIAEKARDIIRNSDNIQSDLQKFNIKIEVKEGFKNGKKWQGAVIIGPKGEKIPLSCLPQDCSLRNIKDKLHGNIQFYAATTVQTDSFYKNTLTAGKAKSAARAIFNCSGSLAEAESKLAAQGMSIERQGKSGGYLRFAEGEQGRMKLTALGGKYSLNALSKKYHQNTIDSITANASKMPQSQISVNRAAVRVEGAQERAANTAAEAGQAKTLSEALDEGFQQAQAADAVRKATTAAREAEARAAAAEAQLAEERKNVEHTTPLRREVSLENVISAPKIVKPAQVQADQQNALKTEEMEQAARIAEARARAQRAAATAAPVSTTVQSYTTTTTNNLTHKQ